MRFRNQLTFLTGINGSGKTTVVSSLFDLLSPQLERLVALQFNSMEVQVTGEDGKFRIGAERSSEEIVVRCEPEAETLTIPLVGNDERFAQLDRAEQRKFYRDFEARHVSHPVLKRIKSLPTPMFLGIDRRHLEDDDRKMRYRMVQSRTSRNVFGASLGGSLLDASFLARDSFNSVQAQQTGLADALRTELILGALEWGQPGPTPDPPMRIEAEDLDKIQETLRALGIPKADLDKRLNRFATRLNNIIKNLPKAVLEGGDLPMALGDLQGEQLEAVFEWSVNRPQFDRLRKIMQEVRAYVRRVQELKEPLDQYRDTVNNFLKDSGKAIGFSPTGVLQVLIGGKPRHISALSSGESQLVVILSHLAFNPAAREANVFIVDEPELSLHLRWQELFVDAVQSVNPSLQVILATHSPAIILDRLENCIDLTGGRRA